MKLKIDVQKYSRGTRKLGARDGSQKSGVSTSRRELYLTLHRIQVKSEILVLAAQRSIDFEQKSLSGESRGDSNTFGMV